MLFDKEKWDKPVVLPVVKPWQQVLLNAADLIQTKGWGTGQLWTPLQSGARSNYCVLGAFWDTPGSPWAKFIARRKLKQVLIKALKKEGFWPRWAPAFTVIVNWNDHNFQGGGHVVETMRKAAFS